MGLWNPFVAYGATRGNPLTPYSSAVFLTLGALLSCFVWNMYFMKNPLAGRTGEFQRIFQRPALRSSAGTCRRSDLGHRNGVQRGRGKVDELCDFLCHRPIGADGRRRCGECLPGRNLRAQGLAARFTSALMFVFYALAILLVARANG